MCNTIVYRARVILQGELALVQTCSRDNNLIPLSGRHSDGLSWETAKELPLSDLEACAQWLEGLARGYDGGGIRESGRSLDGSRAYALWKGRFESATGLELRAALLERVFYSGVPPGLFSGKPRFEIRKGCALSVADAARFVTDYPGERLPVAVSSRSSFDFKGRLGFLWQGQLCAYRQGQKKSGTVVPTDATLTALEGFDTWAHRPWLSPSTIARPETAPAGEGLSVLTFDGTSPRVVMPTGEALELWSFRRNAPAEAFSAAGAAQAIAVLQSLCPTLRCFTIQPAMVPELAARDSDSVDFAPATEVVRPS